MSLSDEKYVAVGTYRRSGEVVTTPTWITPLSDGRVGFWTSSASGKAKRLRNDPRLTIQPSDPQGKPKPGSTPVTGKATLVTEGAEFTAIQSQIKAEYGFMVHLSRIFNTLGHLGKNHPYGDLGIVITLDA